MNIVNMKITDIRPYEKNPRHNDGSGRRGRQIDQGIRQQQFFLILTRRESKLWTPPPMSRK